MSQEKPIEKLCGHCKNFVRNTAADRNNRGAGFCKVIQNKMKDGKLVNPDPIQIFAHMHCSNNGFIHNPNLFTRKP